MRCRYLDLEVVRQHKDVRFVSGVLVSKWVEDVRFVAGVFEVVPQY